MIAVVAKRPTYALPLDAGAMDAKLPGAPQLESWPSTSTKNSAIGGKWAPNHLDVRKLPCSAPVFSVVETPCRDQAVKLFSGFQSRTEAPRERRVAGLAG